MLKNFKKTRENLEVEKIINLPTKIQMEKIIESYNTKNVDKDKITLIELPEETKEENFKDILNEIKEQIKNHKFAKCILYSIHSGKLNHSKKIIFFILSLV